MCWGILPCSAVRKTAIDPRTVCLLSGQISAETEATQTLIALEL